MGLPVESTRASQDLITLKNEGVNFGGAKSFNFTGKMLMVGDFNLNSIQGYSNSLREVLRQTMLSQEVTFRKQVCELHRLYRIQKDLMEDFGCEEFYGNNLLKARMQSAMGPFANPPQYSPLANRRMFAGSLMVGSPQYENKGFLEEKHCGCLSLRQRSFDLQLPAKQYVSHVSEDLLDKRNGWDWKEPLKLKHQFHGDNMSFWEEVKLTLSIGRDTTNEEQNSFTRGFNEQDVDFVSNDMFAKRKPSTSHEAISLDLNRVQFDVSPHSNDPTVTFPSKVGSSGAFDGLMGNFDEGTYSAPSKGISQIEVFPIDLESESAPPSGIDEDLGNDHKSSGQGSRDSLLKSPKGNHAEGNHAEENHKGAEDGRLEKSPTSCKFDCIADDSSSAAKTMQSGTDLGGSSVSIFNRRCPKSESSQVMETRSDEHDSTSSDNNKEESLGGDIHILIQEAVETLLHFSSGSSTSNQDSCTKAGSNEAENRVRDQQPQHSMDSYESMVLKLTESSGVDDCCVSSKAPFEINESDSKDLGFKLRRGRRRLKDFQRDILPAMASLSKHEIREDLNIMETVIRSREYKRMRSKMAGGRNWFTPVKSRRSRLNYVGRRYYS